MAGESLADVFRRLAAKSGGIIPRDWGDWCECLALWRVNLRAWRASAKSYAARYGRRARLTRLAVYQRETARQHAREVIEALRLIRDSLAAAARAKALHVEVEMLLPAGKRCRDCAHRARCVWLLGARFSEANQHCDWAPSRFIDRAAAETAVAAGLTPDT
jgi:hypothetical protein